MRPAPSHVPSLKKPDTRLFVGAVPNPQQNAEPIEARKRARKLKSQTRQLSGTRIRRRRRLGSSHAATAAGTVEVEAEEHTAHQGEYSEETLWRKQAERFRVLLGENKRLRSELADQDRLLRHKLSQKGIDIEDPGLDIGKVFAVRQSRRRRRISDGKHLPGPDCTEPRVQEEEEEEKLLDQQEPFHGPDVLETEVAFPAGRAEAEAEDCLFPSCESDYQCYTPTQYVPQPLEQEFLSSVNQFY